MIKAIIKSKNLTKYISCECKCRLMKQKCSSVRWWNNDKCRCDCKKCHACETYYIWNAATCSCENGKYLTSIIDNPVITHDEIIESYDEETDVNTKKATCKTQNVYILHAFLLIVIALLMAVSI